MKNHAVFFFLLMAASVGAAATESRDLIPVEDFARAPLFTRVQISPDGHTLGFLAEKDGNPVIMFADLQTRKAEGITAGVAPLYRAPQQVRSFQDGEGLAKSPGLYRCGISIAGVADWLGIIKGKTSGEYKFAYQHWVDQIGDPKHDAEFLRSISPVNFADKITAPLLIIQGKEDRTVPPKQARILIAALEKAGRPPTSLFLSGDGHGLTTEKSRIEAFRHIEEFLSINLGPEHTGP